MACNFKVNIEFRLPIKKAIEVMEYCESRGMDFIGMCDNNPYDYNSDIQSLEYHNSIWMENNLERIIKNCKKVAGERSTKSEVLLIMRPRSSFNLIELE